MIGGGVAVIIVSVPLYSFSFNIQNVGLLEWASPSQPSIVLSLFCVLPVQLIIIIILVISTPSSRRRRLVESITSGDFVGAFNESDNMALNNLD